MSTTEDKVPTGKAAFAAARASVQSSPDPEPAPPVEESASPETTETPVEESPKVEDQPQEATDTPDPLLSADEVAKLTPAQKKQYDQMNRAWTQKTQALAAQRKEFEKWQPLIESLTADPDTAIQQLAEHRGFTVSKAQQQAVEAAASDTLAQLPAELQFLKPVFEQFGQTILSTVEGKLKPVVEAQTQMISEAAAAESQATVEAFSATHPGWEKHQDAMIALGKKVIPTAGQMTDREYMEMLYTLVTAKESEAEKTKKVVDRINKAVASSETKTAGLSSDRVEHAMPPPDKRSIREAYAAAKRGEVWTK